MKELFSKIKLIGVKSGIIEISYGSFDIEPVINIDFYDEDTGVDCLLDSITLAEFNPIKESYVIGEFDLRRIKNSNEANTVKMLLLEKGKEIEFEVVARAKELANEISERAGIPVKVVPQLQGQPSVASEFDMNM